MVNLKIGPLLFCILTWFLSFDLFSILHLIFFLPLGSYHSEAEDGTVKSHPVVFMHHPLISFSPRQPPPQEAPRQFRSLMLLHWTPSPGGISGRPHFLHHLSLLSSLRVDLPPSAYVSILLPSFIWFWKTKVHIPLGVRIRKLFFILISLSHCCLCLALSLSLSIIFLYML